MYEREKKVTKIKKAKTLFTLALMIGLIGKMGMGENKNISYAAKVNTAMHLNTLQNTADTTSVPITTGSAVTDSAIKEDDKESDVEKSNITGWVHENQKWLYYKNGKVQKKNAGWYEINNKYYYLKSDGSHVKKSKGFYDINNKWIYLSGNGEKITKDTGWYKISKQWYYIKSNGSYPTGFKTINRKKYYFGKKGVLTNGWVKAGKKEYYQTKSHGIYKNAVLKNSSNGKYYYVDETGKKIDNKLTRHLVKVYRSCTKESMSKEQKLYALYMYLATPSTKNKHFKYERRYDDYKYIGKSGWTADYAYQLLSSGKGNCYRFACTFGYFAKMLGYDSYVQVGKCRSTRGGLTPHSWVEIKINGTTYVYDPELQFAGAAPDLYKKTYSTHPVSIKKGTAYKIKF